MTDLGTLGGDSSYAVRINNLGQIVGRSMIATSSSVEHAFLWENGVMTDLGTLGGHGWSRAEGINDQGQVVGNSNFRAFLWDDGTMQDLGHLDNHLDAPWSWGMNPNEKGRITGFSLITDPLTGAAYAHCYYWKNGRMTDLGTLGGNECFGHTINNEDQIVGESSTDPNVTPNHAFLWDKTDSQNRKSWSNPARTQLTRGTICVHDGHDWATNINGVRVRTDREHHIQIKKTASSAGRAEILFTGLGTKAQGMLTV